MTEEFKICLDNEIKYDDPNEWKKYFENLYRIYLIAHHIKIFDERIRKYHEKTLDQIYNSENEFDRIVYRIILSGLSGDYEKPFNDESLSRFYYEIYGFGISEDKARELLLELNKKSNKQNKDILKQVIIEYNYSSLISTIKDIREKLKEFLNREHIQTVIEIQKLQEEIDNMISKFEGIEKGSKLLELFLNTSRGILPQYSRLSFFILSLNRNIKIYLEEYYRKLFYDNKLKDKIYKYLGLREWEIVPGLKGIAIDYCPGEYIIDALLSIFYVFSNDTLRKYFTNIQNELEDYVTKSWQALGRIGFNSMFEDFLWKIHEHPEYKLDKLEPGSITGRWIGSLVKLNEFIIIKISVNLEKLTIKKIIELFNVIHPLLMYGLAYYPGPYSSFDIYTLVHRDIIPW